MRPHRRSHPSTPANSCSPCGCRSRRPAGRRPAGQLQHDSCMAHYRHRKRACPRYLVPGRGVILFVSTIYIARLPCVKCLRGIENLVQPHWRTRLSVTHSISQLRCVYSRKYLRCRSSVNRHCRCWMSKPRSLLSTRVASGLTVSIVSPSGDKRTKWRDTNGVSSGACTVT